VSRNPARRDDFPQVTEIKPVSGLASLTLLETETYTDQMVHPLRRGLLFSARLLAVASMVAPIFVDAQGRQHALYVSVVDSSGNPVAGLTPADFVVRENKVSREIVAVAPAADPMQIAVLVDNSAASEQYLRDYREALTTFVTAILADTPRNGKHQIALVGLASRPTILKDYTSDQAQLLKTALGMFAMPDTGAYFLDGVIEVSQGISKRQSPRPVMVAILSEGRPDLSDRSFDTVLRPLRASNAALHVVKVGPPLDMSHDRAVVIDEGTRGTGGRNEEVLTSTGLPNLMKQLAAELTHQYLVTYARPDTLIPPDAATVSVNKPGLTARGIAVREERPQERR
jgi:hypothetical protein